MYSVLGRIGKSKSEDLISLLPVDEDRFFRDLNYIDVKSQNACFATSGENGKFIGIAYKDSVTLVYLGAIHHPFPGWSGDDNPLHDTTKTAKLLLDRYFSDNDDFLNGVCGHYVVSVYDSNQDLLLLSRDNYGGPRLFYYENDDEVIFSTHFEDFKLLLGSKWVLDRSLEDFLLGYEFLPDNRTIYKNVKILPKGNVLKFKNQVKELKSIRNLEVEQGLLNLIQTHKEEEIMDALFQALTLSIKDICPVNQKIAILMGGFDSMLLASILHSSGFEVETFTFRYKERGYTQALVDKFTSALNIQHNWVDISPDVIKNGFENYSHLFNQPVAQAHYLIASSEAAMHMKMKGINYCITGDGCDGLFLGYPTVHARAKLIVFLSKFKFLIKFIINLFFYSKFLEMKLGYPYRFIRNIGKILSRSMPARGHIASCILDRVSLNYLQQTKTVPQEKTTEEILIELAKGKEDVETLRLAYQGKAYVGLNANKLEGISSSYGITFLSPYLHPRMTFLSENIPDAINRPTDPIKSNNLGKYIFMKMVEEHRLLPKEFIYQTKMSPVTSPVDLWYWSELQDYITTKMQELPFKIDEQYAKSLVKEKLIEKLFRKHIGISKHVTQAAGLLVTYASFNKKTN